MKKLVMTTAAMLVAATSVFAAPLTTTVDTTTVVTDTDINSGSLSQLVSALGSFNGKEITIKGELFTSTYDYYFKTDEGLFIYLTLDDGRAITNRAKVCDKFNSYSPKTSNCSATMTVELEIDSSLNRHSIKGVGYDVDLTVIENQ